MSSVHQPALGAENRFSNRLWGAMALIVGLVILGYSCRLVVLASSQDEWVPVEATVVQSTSTQTTKGSGFRTYTSNHFSYRYVIKGQVYTANRYSFWSIGGDRSSGTSRYRPGESLTIYHHPKRPEIAVVERVRPSMFVWVFVVFGLVLFIRGAVMIKTGKAAG